jgi:hypothetical protein
MSCPYTLFARRGLRVSNPMSYLYIHTPVGSPNPTGKDRTTHRGGNLSRPLFIHKVKGNAGNSLLKYHMISSIYYLIWWKTTR